MQCIYPAVNTAIATCRTKGVVRTTFLAVLAMSIFWSATFLHAEPLLACVLSGIITINRKCASWLTAL